MERDIYFLFRGTLIARRFGIKVLQPLNWLVIVPSMRKAFPLLKGLFCIVGDFNRLSMLLIINRLRTFMRYIFMNIVREREYI